MNTFKKIMTIIITIQLGQCNQFFFLSRGLSLGLSIWMRYEYWTIKAVKPRSGSNENSDDWL